MRNGLVTVGWLTIFAWATAASAAEMRTWTAASGGFSIEAEFVELKPGDLVRLKTKDGRLIEVPLGQLSAADQAIARPAPVATTTVMPAKPTASLLRALKAADRCRMPSEAIVVLKVFHDDPQTSPAEKAYAAGRLAHSESMRRRTWCGSIRSGSRGSRPTPYARRPTN